MDDSTEFSLDPKVFMSPMVYTVKGDLLYTTLWGRSTYKLRRQRETIDSIFPEEETNTHGTVSIQSMDPTGDYRKLLYKVKGQRSLPITKSQQMLNI